MLKLFFYISGKDDYFVQEGLLPLDFRHTDSIWYNYKASPDSMSYGKTIALSLVYCYSYPP